VVLVGFDPQGEPATAAAFRAVYGIENSVTLIGPYAGKLDNSGETLKLLRPEDPGNPATGFVLVDRVTYDDAPPWPVAADGAGASLTRTAIDAFGNFATSWQAADPTPGSASFESSGLPGDVNRDNVVNGLDVDPFVDVLLSGPFQAEADMNHDGVVNGLDVDLFVATVIGDGQAISAATLAVAPLSDPVGLTVPLASLVAVPGVAPLDPMAAYETNLHAATARGRQRLALREARIERTARPFRPSDNVSHRHRLREHAAGKIVAEQLNVETPWTALADHALRDVSVWR